MPSRPSQALSRADLGLLLALDALLTERSVTRAAIRLGVSQPALSAQLARLRDLFGDPILLKSGRRMLPTDRALDLARPLRRLLDEMQDLVRSRRTFDPATAGDTFRISATDYLQHDVGLDLITRAAAAPGVSIALVTFDPATAWRRLEDGAIDLVIASERLTPPEARSRKLHDETFVMVQRKGHPRGGGPVDLDQFCGYEHVLFSPDGGGFVGATDTALAQMDRRRRVAVSVPNLLLTPVLLRDSDRLAMIPARAARAFAAELDAFAPPVPMPTFAVRASWHPRRDGDPAHAWLRGLLARNP